MQLVAGTSDAVGARSTDVTKSPKKPMVGFEDFICRGEAVQLLIVRIGRSSCCTEDVQKVWRSMW